VRSLEELVRDAVASGAQLRVDVSTARKVPADLGLVFHVPLIALSILVTAHEQHGHLSTGALSRWVAGVLSELCFGATEEVRRYQWSFVLRDRCAHALVFLEQARLVDVTDGEQRTIRVNELGRKFLQESADRAAGPVPELLRDLRRAYRAARAKGLMLL
jgi:hypothetical protein